MKLVHKAILYVVIMLPMLNFGQYRKLTYEDYKNSTAEKIYFVNSETCQEIDGWFQEDFNKCTIFIFLQTEAESDDKNEVNIAFEKEFGVYYFNLGCEAPEQKCITKYNHQVFEYLTEQFDTKWISKIREDSIGFKNWEKNKS